MQNKKVIELMGTKHAKYQEILGWFSQHSGYYIALGRSYKRSNEYDLSERALLKASSFTCSNKQKLDVSLLLGTIYAATDRIEFATKLHKQLKSLFADSDLNNTLAEKYRANIFNLGTMIKLKKLEKRVVIANEEPEITYCTYAKAIKRLYELVDIVLDYPKQGKMPIGNAVSRTQSSPIINGIMISDEPYQGTYYSIKNNWPKMPKETTPTIFEMEGCSKLISD